MSEPLNLLRDLFDRRYDAVYQIPEDPYGVPELSFLRVEVRNPKTCGRAWNRYTLSEVRLRTNLPYFRLKESIVSRRYRNFLWLKEQLEKDGRMEVPPLPGKALKRQIPFRRDGGLFGEAFVEERRRGLEQFINIVASDPKAQHLKCVHEFLKEPVLGGS